MTQVVLSRIQNRRGTQAEFNALYNIGAPSGEQLQPGEIGMCTDTKRVFIGTTTGAYTELNAAGHSLVATDALEFIPMQATLVPQTSWTSIGIFAYTVPSTATSIGVLNILYSLTEPVTLATAPYTKNGTLCVTSTTTSASLTDTGSEINLYTGTAPDISFRAIFGGGTVQIQYKHNFTGSLIIKASTVHWVGFN